MSDFKSLNRLINYADSNIESFFFLFFFSFFEFDLPIENGNIFRRRKWILLEIVLSTA